MDSLALFLFHKGLREKLREALASVLPILSIVLVLCLGAVPMDSGVLLTFLIGGAMLIVGMMFFTLGAELSISPMGSHVGAYMTKSRKLSVILGLSFLLGFIITISEPDLQVLAELVPSIPNLVLIAAVALGVALFLVVALARMLFKLPLTPLLIGCYALVFLLTPLVPKSFLAVAFDSGGVTTGPMTVPFIMALGVGISAIRSDREATNDSFGLVALCSVGPVLAVLLLAMVYAPSGADVSVGQAVNVANSVELWDLFQAGFPTYLGEIGMALLPILGFFAAFQLFALRLDPKRLLRLFIGLVYTYVGLVLFLTGANVGFMPAGMYLGSLLASLRNRWIIVPLGMVMGFFIVKAEPAVYVLNRQVSDMTDGNISETSMGMALSVGVAVSVGLGMVRVLTGISILWFLLPGYAIAMVTSFFVPRLYTAIAFDSGGVASGPMTAAFLVPFAQGACQAVGGDLVADAFGIVAMVAMTPLITIQLMGLVAQRKLKREAAKQAAAVLAYEGLDDDAIIQL